MKRWLTFTLTLTVLMAFTTLAAAQQKAQEKKGTIKLDRPILVKPRLEMTGKVTQVNPTAKTFTVMAKGQAVTFTAANLTLPKVGEILDITYTETPGGTKKATTINSTKSQTF